MDIERAVARMQELAGQVESSLVPVVESVAPFQDPTLHAIPPDDDGTGSPLYGVADGGLHAPMSRARDPRGRHALCDHESQS